MVEPCISAAQGAIPGFLDLDVKKYMLLGTQEETIEAMLRYLFLKFFSSLLVKDDHAAFCISPVQ